MKRWGMVAVVMGLIFGSASQASADFWDDMDPSEWYDECALGKALNVEADGLWGADFIGTGDVIGAAGDCNQDTLSMRDFNLREKPGTFRWNAGGTMTNGKLSVDMQRRYGFDSDGNGAVDWYTQYGDTWRWKNRNKGEYFKGRYVLSGKITVRTSAASNPYISSWMDGTALANTGSQTPASGHTANAVSPTGYVYLTDVKMTRNNVRVFAIDTQYNGNAIRIWHVREAVQGQNTVRNSAWNAKNVTLSLGEVWAKSVPKSGSRYQHIVYRPL